MKDPEDAPPSTAAGAGSDPSATVAHGGPAPEPEASSESPERIGRYRILGSLGEGGMGNVFLAEQTRPVRRRVALKVMRSTFLDQMGRLRFDSERQVMARLQHPNIAQIFDADATSEGQPYFVMEHVAGDRITGFCNRQRLTVEQRLGLFGDVCAGVQFAHQKGIIHRDLKPSNILVTEIDGRPLPKIIDFGIAKTLDHPQAGGVQVTGDRLIGTPAYLSPEAAAVGEGGIDVDTRSDVYSLGVLLYELLVGHRPFDDDSTNILQILQRVAVGDPETPSQKWAELDDDARDEVARNRHTDPDSLTRSLRGDLDWIILKAIAKDRGQRYGSAAELAADLRRHLRHEPVEAGPPSKLYRIKKFVRRRSGTVVAAILVLLALTAGVVVRTLEARRANREAAAAIQARQETEAALLHAEQARAETAEISKFLAGLFTVSDPGEAKGNSITARELLDAGAERIRNGFADQPLARARFMQTIADVYRKLGLFETAQELFEEALRIRRQHLESDPLDVAESLNGLAALDAQLGKFEAAEPLFEEALSIREKVLDSDDVKVAMSLNNLANLYSDLGRSEEAEPLYRRSVAIVRKHQGPPSPDLLVGLHNLGTLYLDQQRYAEAEPLLRDFVSYQKEAFGALHPHVAIGLSNLAEVRWQLGDVAEAERLYRQSLEILEEVLDPEHPVVAYCLSSLAGLYADQGRDGEAESLYRRALAVQEATLPEDHPERRATVEGLEKLSRSRSKER